MAGGAILSQWVLNFLETILSFQTMASDSSSAAPALDGAETWTKVGKGGRPVSFPPEAASAFGRRGPSTSARPSAPYRSYGGRSEFPTDAAAAFGRGGRTELTVRYERSERAEFDSAASAAFGSGGGRARREPFGGSDAPEFDSAATSAFGSGSRRPRDSDNTGGGGFPSAFGKKKSLFAEAAEMGFAEGGGGGGGGGYALSALARKRAEAARPPPPKPQTFDEMFPTLGAPAAAPARTATATPSAAPKRTFAELMRERVAEEEAEAEREAAERERGEERRQAEMLENDQVRRLYARRAQATAYVRSSSSGVDDEADAPEAEVNYNTQDLDYDVYGASKTAFSVYPPHAASHDDDEQEEEGDEAGGTYNDDIY